jgi:VIT1/CCC1 family predicted Fe2+/Mn2+ transporter
MTDEDFTEDPGYDEDDEEDGEESAARTQAPVLGPVAGAMVGIVTFFVLGDRFSLLPRLGVSLVVIAVLAYVSVVLARRRG